LETVSHGRKKSHSSMDFRCSLVTRDIGLGSPENFKYNKKLAGKIQHPNGQ